MIPYQRKLMSLVPLVQMSAIVYRYDLDLNGCFDKVLELPDGYSFAYAHDLPQEMLHDFSKNNREPGQFERTIAPNLENYKSCRGLCILYNDTEIASLGWVYFSLEHLKLKEHYPICTNAFYPMDGFVAKQHRGRGLHRRCVSRRFSIAREAGRTIGFGIVYVNNLPAIKDNDRLGRRIGRVISVMGGRKRFNLYTPVFLKLHFTPHT